MRESDWGPPRYVLGGYREYAPPPDLVRVVDGFWTYSARPGTPAAVGHDVLPDPGLGLCFWHRGASSDPSLVVIGPVHEVRRLAPEPGTLLEAVRLRPEWSRDLLGIDPGEQADGLNPLDEVRDRCVRTPSRAANLAARGLEHIRAVRATNMRLDTVVRDLGVSERHLRRVIRETTGCGPKHHHRVARLNRAVAAADHDPDPSWSRLAVRHGFYDQSHLIREFRALAGERPVELHHERLRESLGGRPR